MILKLYKISFLILFVIMLVVLGLVWAAVHTTESAHIKEVSLKITKQDPDLTQVLDSAYLSVKTACSERILKSVKIPAGTLTIDIKCSEVESMSRDEFDRYFIGKVIDQVYQMDSEAGIKNLPGLVRASPMEVASTLFSNSLHREIIDLRTLLVIVLVILGFILAAVASSAACALMSLGIAFFAGGIFGWMMRLLTLYVMSSLTDKMTPIAGSLATGEIAYFFYVFNYLILVGIVFFISGKILNIFHPRETASDRS